MPRLQNQARHFLPYNIQHSNFIEPFIIKTDIHIKIHH